MDNQLLNMAELIEPYFPEASKQLRLRACETAAEREAEVNVQSQREKRDEEPPAWLRHGEHFGADPRCHLCASRLNNQRVWNSLTKAEREEHLAEVDAAIEHDREL